MAITRFVWVESDRPVHEEFLVFYHYILMMSGTCTFLKMQSDIKLEKLKTNGPPIFSSFTESEFYQSVS